FTAEAPDLEILKAPKGRNKNSPGRKPWDSEISKNEPRRGERDFFRPFGACSSYESHHPGAYAPGYRTFAPSGLRHFFLTTAEGAEFSRFLIRGSEFKL